MKNTTYSTHSGKLANLEKGSRLSLELGCVIDNFIYYVKIDEFIIDKPKKEQNTLEVSITGYGILKYLSDSEFTANYYEKSDAQTTFDCLYGYETELLIKVDDELLEENEQIRTQFGTINVPDGINKVATAIRGNVLETIDNKILVKRIKETDAVAKIDINNTISSPEITREEKPKIITINKYAPTSKGIQTVYQGSPYVKDGENNVFKYNAEHTAPPYEGSVLLGGFENLGRLTLGGAIYLEDRCIWCPCAGIDIDGDDNDLTITADVIEITQTSKQYVLDSNSTEEITIDSESIENSTQANKVFEWLKTNYNKQFKYVVEIQDAFTYELGDSVWLATNVYVNGKMLVRKAIITNIEYEYNGALHYYLTLKGA